MDKQIRQRIINILQINHLSQTAFAKLAGMTQNTVNRQLNEATITCALIEAVAQQFPNISMEWLIRGAGNMFVSDVTTTFPALAADESDALSSAMALINQQSEFIKQQAMLIAQLKGQLA